MTDRTKQELRAINGLVNVCTLTIAEREDSSNLHVELTFDHKPQLGDPVPQSFQVMQGVWDATFAQVVTEEDRVTYPSSATTQ